MAVLQIFVGLSGASLAIVQGWDIWVDQPDRFSLAKFSLPACSCHQVSHDFLNQAMDQNA